MINLSLSTGVVPNQMKTAKTIPILKTGDKHLFTNYRPMSILPAFSKVLEKVTANKLIDFLESHNFFTNINTASAKSLDSTPDHSTQLNEIYIKNLFFNIY
jgi:ABC-type tungstate transport system permease subunit